MPMLVFMGSVLVDLVVGVVSGVTAIVIADRLMAKLEERAELAALDEAIVATAIEHLASQE